MGLVLDNCWFFPLHVAKAGLEDPLMFTTTTLEIHPFEYTNVSIIVPCSIIATSFLVPECNSPK